jgi:hypothetical protein
VRAGEENEDYQAYDLTKLYDLARPGRYSVQYIYEEKQPTGWQGRLPSNAAAFEVVAKTEKDKDRAEVKPVVVEGLSFEALVPNQIPLPAPGRSNNVDLWLRVTNVSDKPVTLWTFDVIRPRLYTADGKEVETSIGRNGQPALTPPVLLAPGLRWTWRSEAKLLSMKDGRTLLHGPDGLGVPGAWSFLSLNKGKHRLVIEYANDKVKHGDVALWTGKAVTNPVEFEIIDEKDKKEDKEKGDSASKPVRVAGVDFQAVVEKKHLVVERGVERFIDLGLRLTNHSDKTLKFNLADTIRPVLKSADGTSIKASGGRRETTPVAPVVLAPGKSETVHWGARAELLPDGKSFRLSWTDGTGMHWWFNSGAAGRYLLSFEYENTDGQGFWTGKAMTESVELEIASDQGNGNE